MKQEDAEALAATLNTLESPTVGIQEMDDAMDGLSLIPMDQTSWGVAWTRTHEDGPGKWEAYITGGSPLALVRKIGATAAEMVVQFEHAQMASQLAMDPAFKYEEDVVKGAHMESMLLVEFPLDPSLLLFKDGSTIGFDGHGSAVAGTWDDKTAQHVLRALLSEMRTVTDTREQTERGMDGPYRNLIEWRNAADLLDQNGWPK